MFSIINTSGVAIPIKCDCAKDEELKALVERFGKYIKGLGIEIYRVEKDHGRLDILVNNAINIRDDLKQTPPFWTQDIQLWDAYHSVGLRNHYVLTTYAAPLLVKTSEHGKTSLVVGISSIGGKGYLFNVSYGTAKAAFDRLAKDMAVDFKPYKVCSVSLWPGMVKVNEI